MIIRGIMRSEKTPHLSAGKHELDSNLPNTQPLRAGLINTIDGTIYGASWTTGISGSALSFDGVDDYEEV
jgi:hypothetical protein